MIKTLIMMVSFMIGISMTLLLYILEYTPECNVAVDYDSLYFTVLPLVIFIVLWVLPGDHAFEEY